MREQKTATKNRGSYVYFSVVGKKHVITTEEAEKKWIGLLHEKDDEEFNAQRREDYHVPEHYDAYHNGMENDIAEYNSYFIDEDADPLHILINEFEEQEYQKMIEKLQVALADLTPEQRKLINKRFYLNKSVVEIAEEEGVSRVSIYKRLDVIYKFLEKYFEN